MTHHYSIRIGASRATALVNANELLSAGSGGEVTIGGTYGGRNRIQEFFLA